ncbi:MAG: hypothetical protein PHI38_05745 [Sulfurimonas sp.]|jgi:hypothetical protein|uniref:hypothetical protein n=1 Tax=Sulfurimonas sp. TaxID=2022749 RepID=UPI002624AB3B|nr:hypothetical protein [Sulfurimonas sp.]MDD3476352.1 hypothetical protein [Sulfurimonas sp.]HUH42945.1 hypothetical protein [Sulfurimonas sp.]
MDGIMYPVSLLAIALMAFTFYQNNSIKLMVIVLAIGGYIIYSHETGYSATEFKNEMIDSLDKSARDFSKSRGTEGYDETKLEKKLKD